MNALTRILMVSGLLFSFLNQSTDAAVHGKVSISAFDPPYQVYYIPLIFNVISAPGDPEITDEMIDEEIKRLNTNFSGKNKGIEKLPERLRSHVADSKIRFYRSGEINRRRINAPIPSTQFHVPENGGIKPTDWAHTINIYFGNLIKDKSTDKDGKKFGYAQLPKEKSTAPIIINTPTFGEKPSTLTHEVGHHLGVPHLIDEKGVADGFEDTPDDGSMKENFMTDKLGGALFTPEQIKRMRATLGPYGFRRALVSRDKEVVPEFYSNPKPDLAPTITDARSSKSRILLTLNLHNPTNKSLYVNLSYFKIRGKIGQHYTTRNMKTSEVEDGLLDLDKAPPKGKHYPEIELPAGENKKVEIIIFNPTERELRALKNKNNRVYMEYELSPQPLATLDFSDFSSFDNQPFVEHPDMFTRKSSGHVRQEADISAAGFQQVPDLVTVMVHNTSLTVKKHDVGDGVRQMNTAYLTADVENRSDRVQTIALYSTQYEDYASAPASFPQQYTVFNLQPGERKQVQMHKNIFPEKPIFGLVLHSRNGGESNPYDMARDLFILDGIEKDNGEESSDTLNRPSRSPRRELFEHHARRR